MADCIELLNKDFNPDEFEYYTPEAVLRRRVAVQESKFTLFDNNVRTCINDQMRNNPDKSSWMIKTFLAEDTVSADREIQILQKHCNKLGVHWDAKIKIVFGSKHFIYNHAFISWSFREEK